MRQRRVQSATVLCRRNAERIAIAGPGDFVCARAEPLADLPPDVLPYCIDFLRARAVYVGGVSPAAAMGAPFYYLHLRRTAETVLSMPIERGLRLVPYAPDPVFLFSPGRCGSTLLSRVLHEAGIASVSEPDFYTQMAAWFWSRRANPLAPPFVKAMWAMSAYLSAALGSVPVVKLRAECARTPDLFVRDPEVPAVMLLRGFESWSRSTAQAFGAGPAKAVGKYLTALTCAAWLQRHRRCHVMRYEDWLSDPAGAADGLSRFLGRPIPPDAVARALASPSQEGTPLEGRIRPDWEAKWAAARDLWQSPRLLSARKRLDPAGLWD
jgi:hypothetical protein